MTTIGQTADSYEGKTTKNISDLPEVSLDCEILDDEYDFTDKTTKELKTVKQKVISLNGENYRVPSSVIAQLKVCKEDNPNLKKFKVKKIGSGFEGTKYQVIPLA
jgi:hypothetical protein